MADILRHFFQGVKDSVKLTQGIKDVMSSLELIKRTLQITLINGVIYLGSVFVYNLFLSRFLGSNDDSSTVVDGGIMSYLYIVIRLVFTLGYQVWIFIIYIMALTLTTFWVQDIFDELI